MRIYEPVARPGVRTQRSVTISVEAPEAVEVPLAGEFTNWESRPLGLAKGSGGRWSTTIELAPGKYEYRLLIDGAWSDHPEASHRVPNAFGTENCLLIVGE